jgi:hypothetical protein
MNPRPVKVVAHADHSLTMTFANGEIAQTELA